MDPQALLSRDSISHTPAQTHRGRPSSSAAAQGQPHRRRGNIREAGVSWQSHRNLRRRRHQGPACKMYREREKRPPVPHPSAEAEHLTKSEGANQNPRGYGWQPKIRVPKILKTSKSKQCPAIGGAKRKSSSRLGHKLLINRFCCGKLSRADKNKKLKRSIDDVECGY